MQHAIGGKIPTYACRDSGGGWDDEPVLRDGKSVLRFTCLIMWDSKQARLEWCQHFARGAIQSYELLGHIGDRFQLLTAAVESLSLGMDMIY